MQRGESRECLVPKGEGEVDLRSPLAQSSSFAGQETRTETVMMVVEMTGRRFQRIEFDLNDVFGRYGVKAPNVIITTFLVGRGIANVKLVATIIVDGVLVVAFLKCIGLCLASSCFLLPPSGMDSFSPLEDI